jgi:hypothetical protein
MRVVRGTGRLSEGWVSGYVGTLKCPLEDPVFRIGPRELWRKRSNRRGSKGGRRKK